MDLSQLKNPKVPADFSKALKTNRKAEATWNDITPNMRRDWILWMITGKLAETRVSRINKAITMLSSGKRRVCCFGGYKWLVKMAKEKEVQR